MKKNYIGIILIRLFQNILFSTPWSTNHAHMCWQQDGFYFTWKFSFLYFWIHIYQISQICTIWTKIWGYHLKKYMTACFQIRNRIIPPMFFGYVLGLYIFSSHMWKFSTYFGDRKVLELNVSLFRLNKMDYIHNIISCPIKHQIWNTTRISISKIAYSNQASSLTFIILFSCNWIESL